MSDLGWLCVTLAALHVVSSISWKLERRELINKIMSRNFHDYQFAKNVDKTMRPDGVDLREGIKHEEALAEDLSPIQGFGMN